MLTRTFFVCLFVGLYSAGSSLSCRWMDHKFRQYSENSLALVETMVSELLCSLFKVTELSQLCLLQYMMCVFVCVMQVSNSTNSTEGEVQDTVAFPNDLYSQASKASAEDKVVFTVQALDEMAALFEEDYSSASFEEKTVKDFLSVVTQQADGLRSCVSIEKQSSDEKNKNKKNEEKKKTLHTYFKILSSHVLKRMRHSAKSWELIRKEIKTHLMRADQLVSSLLTN
ncbi:interferon a3-like isoform X1 [Trachinotus anak]|uniref:interferon a3-like isoform X1 n=1 Tax=Trachinotus anak TaxID=443729 RepID=UPI0039F24F1E